MHIQIDDLEGPEVASLINEHLHSMAIHSPQESIHALNLESLKKPEITFWTVWIGNVLVGCGALQELDNNHGEVKSMKTSSAYLRRGIASRMLQHIINEAMKRGYERISLETGSMEAFEPARKMYARFGFQYCKPFSCYVEDENSVFMTKELKITPE